jgi:D-alanyl-D-alanine carboxypeptidase-like protein
MVLPVQAGERNRQSVPLASICDNDGHCTTSGVASTPIARANQKKVRAASTAITGSTVITPQSETKVTIYKTPKIALDANGNKTPGIVFSTKTGARAHVGVPYAARFQAYIDDLENNHGARVLFMAGIRPGHCLSESQHPCGKALDVCQVGWGKVDPRCNLPDRATLGRIAAAHGLFEGGRWCHSDYGHVQTSVTAAACGEDPFRLVRRTTLEPEPTSSRP